MPQRWREMTEVQQISIEKSPEKKRSSESWIRSGRYGPHELPNRKLPYTAAQSTAFQMMQQPSTAIDDVGHSSEELLAFTGAHMRHSHCAFFAIMDDYKMPMGTGDGMRYTGISANSLNSPPHHCSSAKGKIGSHLNSPKNISSNLTKAKGSDSPTSSTATLHSD